MPSHKVIIQGILYRRAFNVRLDTVDFIRSHLDRAIEEIIEAYNLDCKEKDNDQRVEIAIEGGEDGR